MNFDELESLWNKQPEPKFRELERDVLADLRSKASAFGRAVFWRDAQECIAALAVSLFFGGMAWNQQVTKGDSWPLWTAALLPLGVIAFFLIDRFRHRHLRPVVGGTLLDEVQRSLFRFRHQEWLLRNVLWWYITPLFLSGAIVSANAVASIDTAFWPIKVIMGGCLLLFLVAANAVVLRLNQRAIKTRILPEIERMERTLEELSAEP